MKNHIHYEKAFEQLVRERQLPYVAVDEAKRAAFRDAKLKSFDFIVYAPAGTNWLVDVKGRRWTARGKQRKPAWENWATQADLDGLQQWQRVFGVGFRALLVFAYALDSDAASAPAELVHTYRDRRYIFTGLPVDTYVENARMRSPKWGTVSLPTAVFAEHVRPLAELLA